MNLLPAVKRPVKEIDYGFVGDITSDTIPASNWMVLLEKTISFRRSTAHMMQRAHTLNTNADTIGEVAKGIGKTSRGSFLYSFEKAGVLSDTNDESSVISPSPGLLKQLKVEQKIFAA